MRKLIGIAVLSVFFVMSCSQTNETANGKVYGNGVSLAKVMTVSDVVGQADALKGQTIRLKGKVASVCLDEGCKIELADGNRFITVRFKDDAFRAPKDCVGQTVDVEGVFLSSGEDIQCADEAAGKTCPEATKYKDGVFSKDDCCAGNANRINYNFIASGMVLL